MLLKTLHTVFPVQCLCHTSVDSQEDKRVGVTKNCGDGEETTGRRNHTEC